jgi:nucleoside-diphosphate-sugar epimerase
MYAEDYIRSKLSNYVIIRPIAVYGPGDNNTRVINKWIMAAIEGRDVVVEGPGTFLDFTYVTDLASLIKTAGESKINGAFNCSGGKPINMLEAASTVVNIVGSNSKVVEKNIKSNMPIRGGLSIERAKLIFDYEPMVDFNTGVRRVYDDLSSLC